MTRLPPGKVGFTRSMSSQKKAREDLQPPSRETRPHRKATLSSQGALSRQNRVSTTQRNDGGNLCASFVGSGVFSSAHLYYADQRVRQCDLARASYTRELWTPDSEATSSVIEPQGPHQKWRAQGGQTLGLSFLAERRMADPPTRLNGPGRAHWQRKHFALC